MEVTAKEELAFPSETVAFSQALHSRRAFCRFVAGGLIGGILPRATHAGETAEPLSVSFTANANGSLVIGGGGDLTDEIHNRFMELAGGKENARIVVIPTASSKADNPEESFSTYWEGKERAAICDLLHTRNRKQADDPAFTRPLREATGVWLSGGRQKRLLDAYGDTLVEKELHDLLTRGGVIGGTSAGASSMSRLMIENGKTSAELGTGFGFVRGAVIDQHFGREGRFTRLQGVVESKECEGIGIDERTALVIRGQIATVMGMGNVRIFFPPSRGEQSKIQICPAGKEVRLKTFDVAAADTRTP